MTNKAPSRTEKWFRELLNFAVEKTRPRARQWVARQRAKSVRSTHDEIAQRAIFQDSVLAMTVGGFSGAAGMLPIIGHAMRFLTSTPEDIFITYRRIAVIVFVAAAFDRELEGDDFIDQALLVFACSAGIEHARETFALFAEEKDLIRFGTYFTPALRKRLFTEVPVKTVKTYGAVSLLRKLPFISLPLNVTLDYNLVSSTGVAAKHFFDNLRYSREDLAAIDRELYQKQKAMLQLMLHMARADGALDESEHQLLRSMQSLLAIPPSEVSRFEKDLLKRPDVESMATLFSRDDRALVMKNVLRVMQADGILAPGERAFFEYLRKAFAVTDEQVARLQEAVATEAPALEEL